MDKQQDEELKQLLDKIIGLIESDMMRGVVASRVIRLVAEHHDKLTTPTPKGGK